MLVNGKQGDLISIRDRGLLYGDGVFRTLRASRGHALHWPLHFKKLQHDCATLGISCPDDALLSTELSELLEKSPDAVIKLIVTRGSGSRGYTPADCSEPTRIWDVSPLTEYPPDRAIRGIKARLCHFRLGLQPRLAGVKHLNRLENVLAAAEPSDADEGLLMDTEGRVIEGVRSNLFMLSKDTLITPALTRCGVAGVQRDRVIDWAARHGMPLQVRDVSLEDVMAADELFFVNSLITLWPVRELEQRRWSEFPVAGEIRRYLDRQDAS